MKTTMHCPKCNIKLIKSDYREFETLSDHICDPNRQSYPKRLTYKCKNIHCACSMHDVFWDEYGDYYGGFAIKFKDDLYSAIPSFARKQDVEIYKKGLKKQIYLHPIFMLWFLQPMIEFNYKSNEYGEVLKKSYKLCWLKKDSWKPWVKDRFGYHTYYTFPIVNIIHHVKHNYLTFKNCSEQYKKQHIKDMLQPLPSWDKRWWRKVEKFLDKVLFARTIKKLNN